MKRSRFIHYAAPALLLGLMLFSCKKKEDLPQPVDRAVRSQRSAGRGDRERRPDHAGRVPGALHPRRVQARARGRARGQAGVPEPADRAQDDAAEAQRKRIKIGLPEINKRIEGARAENGKDVKETLSGLGIDFEKWKADVWEDMMIERLLAREVNKHVSVPPPKCGATTRQISRSSRSPSRCACARSWSPPRPRRRRSWSCCTAGTDFRQLAREKSTAPEAERGGDLGYFAMGDMPAEFNVVFGMQKGGVSGIVKSPYGYHIFKLEDKRKAGQDRPRRGVPGDRREAAQGKRGQALQGVAQGAPVADQVRGQLPAADRDQQAAAAAVTSASAARPAAVCRTGRSSSGRASVPPVAARTSLPRSSTISSAVLNLAETALIPSSTSRAALPRSTRG